MNDSEFIPLDEESTAEKAFDALRQLGLPHMPDCGVGEHPDSLSLRIERRCGYDCGVSWEERTDVLAYRISWRRHSFYRGCNVENGYAGSGAIDMPASSGTQRSSWTATSSSMRCFWTGKRKRRDDGKFGDELIVKWIPPISINEDAGEVVETIHR